MNRLVDTLFRGLGRERAWRLGRSLYLAARGEGTNQLGGNSEVALMEIAARAWADRPGGDPPVILDIGANLGRWSDLARATFEKAGLNPRFHLFEPSPATLDVLDERFGTDEWVMIHRLALSDADGEAQFHLTSPTGGRNSLVAHKGDEAETISVQVRKGGTYLDDLPIDQVALAKIDAEGHDPAVLAGLESWLVSRRIAAVQFEYSWRWLTGDNSMKNLFALVERTGYLLANVVEGRLEIIPEWNPELDRFFEWNYVLVSPDAIDAMPHCHMRWTQSNTLAPS